MRLRGDGDTTITTYPGILRPILNRTMANTLVKLDRDDVLALVHELTRHLSDDTYRSVWVLVEGGDVRLADRS